ncbi:glycosyltransferase [Caballeronia sp. M1242]|uniref:glycosyltransferase n=2 Tax=unclassified Caballeronia TaxID=2646786 RepID=UPI0035303FBA
MYPTMTSYSPLVTVVLPVYNGQRFLRDTLESISAQQREDVEVVIVDDGSSDDSWDIISQWSSAQPFHVRTVRKPTNYGVCAALIDATSVARGRYIAQIGHDDVWLPGHLSGLVDALERHPDASAAFADIAYINAEGMPANVTIFNHALLRSNTHAELFAALLSGNFLCAPASMFRRDRFRQSFWGVSNERLQDFELWLNLLFEGRFVSSEASTCLYRVHANNLSSGSAMRRQSEYELLATLTRVLLSERFGRFYRSIELPDERLAFVDSAHARLINVTEYAPAIRSLHSMLLENLVALEDVWPARINALRAELALRLGMYRKYLAISKTYPAHYADSLPHIPYLVPVHDKVGSPYAALVEAGVFRDGRGVDVAGSGTVYFFACPEHEVEAHMKYPSFAEAVARRRLIVFGAEATQPVQSGFALGSNARVDHGLIDKIFRFFEEDHGSFQVHSEWRGAAAPLQKTMLRRLYHRTGGFVPERYRPAVAAGVRRLLRRR